MTDNLFLFNPPCNNNFSLLASLVRAIITQSEMQDDVTEMPVTGD